jgi:hypothetical protein
LAIPEGSVVIQGLRNVYTLDPQNRLWRIEYGSGVRQPVSGSFADLDYGASAIAAQQVNLGPAEWSSASSISVSDNDSKFAFASYRYSAKLVMIENIFK